jgi:hypothetical protein
VVEAIAPFGGTETMVKDLEAQVVPGHELHHVAIGSDGKKLVKVAHVASSARGLLAHCAPGPRLRGEELPQARLPGR